MTLSEYQDRAAGTDVGQASRHEALNYGIVALCGEAGELANKWKKVLRKDGDTFPTEVFVDELGDVLWYLAKIARDLSVTLEVVGARNLEKLQSRKERGTLKGSGDNR